jgi:thymidylate synthase (FAD)
MNTLCLKTANKSVLRQGFVNLIDCMPRVIPQEANKLKCDYAVVQAARVSYSQGLKDFNTDRKLIHYLYKNKHTSPFEMVKFKFHVKAPIFVARQWFRHRMGNYNEISGRYTMLNEELYTPLKVNSQSKTNKQLSSNECLLDDEHIKSNWKKYMTTANLQFYNYKELLTMGVSREIARIGLPLNLYTEFYFTIDLHNLLNFIKLRNSPNAQYEIKEYAKTIEEIISEYCPITMEAFKEYKTVTLSKSQLKSIRIHKDLSCSHKEFEDLYNIVKLQHS